NGRGPASVCVDGTALSLITGPTPESPAQQPLHKSTRREPADASHRCVTESCMGAVGANATKGVASNVALTRTSSSTTSSTGRREVLARGQRAIALPTLQFGEIGPSLIGAQPVDPGGGR